MIFWRKLPDIVLDRRSHARQIGLWLVEPPILQHVGRLGAGIHHLPRHVCTISVYVRLTATGIQHLLIELGSLGRITIQDRIGHYFLLRFRITSIWAGVNPCLTKSWSSLPPTSGG